MRKPSFDQTWSDACKQAYLTDSSEFWGNVNVNPGYVYAYQRRFSVTMALVERHLPRGSTLIDVAAGSGNFTHGLAERGYRVTWNDLQAELAGYVELKREPNSWIEYRPGNAIEMADGEYDAVMANEVIEHVAHPDALLASLSSLCRPSGLIFLSTPNGGYRRNRLPTFGQVEDFGALEAVQFQPGAEGHLFLFTNDELRRLAGAAGLEVVVLKNFTSGLLGGDFAHSIRTLRSIPRGLVERLDQAIERRGEDLLMNTALVLRKAERSL